MPPEPTGTPGATPRGGEQDAWAAMGLITAGVLFWGGVGYLLSRWLGNPIPVLVGLLLGMAGGLYLVWFRYGRPPAQTAVTTDNGRREGTS